MHKIILTLLFLTLHLNAGEKFNETRYIYAIDKEIHYEGEITFLDKNIRIDYVKPNEQSIIYNEDDEIAQKRYFFMILSAIHSGDESILSEFFEVQKSAEHSLLMPLDLVKDFIKQVKYKKQDKSLEFLKIQMQNDDWILIETLR